MIDTFIYVSRFLPQIDIFVTIKMTVRVYPSPNSMEHRMYTPTYEILNKPKTFNERFNFKPIPSAVRRCVKRMPIIGAMTRNPVSKEVPSARGSLISR